MRLKFLRFFLTGCFLFSFSFFVWPQASAFEGFFFGRQAGEIEIYAGDIEIIETDGLERVSVRNPDIADVRETEDDKLIISANRKGITHLFYWDRKGRNELRIRVLPDDVSDIHRQVEKILQDLEVSSVSARLLKEQGRVLLLGAVRNEAKRTRMHQALGALSEKITDLTTVEEDKLVEIAVKVLEVRTGASSELGFGLPSSFRIDEVTPLPAASSWADLFKLSPRRGTPLELSLDLMVSEGKARILSRPLLVCQSGKDAELLVGGERPIFETRAGEDATGATVSYKDYGIKLNISPVVVGEDRIELVLEVEVIDIEDDIEFGTGEARAQAFPTFIRSINTSLYLDEGETLVMGGLIQEKTSEDLEKFPWLGDIPILGAFFRRTTKREGGGAEVSGDKELFITLTPRIIHSRPREAYRPKPSELEKQDLLMRDKRIPQELQDYILKVQRKILGQVSYPADLAGTGWRGELLLELQLTRTGELKEVEIISSSGYEIFDRHTLNLVKNLTFPSFSPEMRQREIKVAIPVVYAER